jgi:hypothetical protein
MARKELNDTDIAELPAVQDRPRDMKSTGDAMESLDERVIDTVEGPDAMAHAQELLFMEEKLEIMILDSTDKNAERVIYVGVNGRNQYFQRNTAQVVRRKFVEALARAKETRYTQEEYMDANGDRAIRNHSHTALKYPFTIIRDENPKGAAWLRKVLSEG